VIDHQLFTGIKNSAGSILLPDSGPRAGTNVAIGFALA